MIVLAGDIGGTHARLGLFEVGTDRVPSLLHERTVRSTDYPGPAPIVREFLDLPDSRTAGEPDGVSVAIAGPVRDGICRVPNLGWTVELERFRADISVPDASLLNDFEAVGYGVPLLRQGDYAELQPGRQHAYAPIAILGPGTGLGQAFLLPAGAAHRVQASEGGHADFAPRTAEEWALAEYLRARYGRASCERVISGPGLVDIYGFLVASGFGPESDAIREELASGDRAAVISRHGLQGTDRLCEKALEMFTSALGSQAGNLALTLVAYGGVYLVGSIARRILNQLDEESFLEAFRGKGRLSNLLEGIPVRVVLDERIGLRGAARHAAESLLPDGREPRGL